MGLLILILWILCGVIGYHAGKERTIGAGAGVALGLLLGIVGVIIIICFPRQADDDIHQMSYDAKIAQSYADMEPNGETSADELSKWFDLKEKGAITAEEFEEKKKSLIRK